MDLATVKKHYAARPFHSFGLELKDGTVLEVRFRWDMAFVPDGKTLDVNLPDGDWTLVKLDEIKRIVPVPQDKAPSGEAS